jgi:hypothetical protein
MASWSFSAAPAQDSMLARDGREPALEGGGVGLRRPAAEAQVSEALLGAVIDAVHHDPHPGRAVEPNYHELAPMTRHGIGEQVLLGADRERRAEVHVPFQCFEGVHAGIELALERRVFSAVDAQARREFFEGTRRARACCEAERRDYDNGARTAAIRECSEHFSHTFARHYDETPPTAGNVYRALSSAAIAHQV